jgi:hypothetical protein
MILLILMSILLGASVAVRTENVNDQTEAAIPTLTVCEALSHASEYDGKMVRIRGPVYGTDEGTWFVGGAPT